MPKKKKSLISLNQALDTVALPLQPIQNLFIIKAIFMILLATLLIWNSTSFLADIIEMIILIFFMVNGLIMIASGLMNSSRHPHNRQLIPALVFGGLSIIAGTLPLIFVNSVLPLAFLVIIFGIALDFLYTLVSINFLSPNRDHQWWMIASGLIGVITLSNLIFSSLTYFNYWLIFYLACQGIIYFCAPIFLSGAKSK